MSETADELRKRLKEQREQDGRQREVGLNTSSSTGNASSNPQGLSGSSSHAPELSNGPENGRTERGDTEVREPIKPVRRRTHSNQGHDSTTSNPQGKLVGSTGSTSQDDRRAGSSIGRSSENNPTDRPNGIDLRASVSSSEQSAITPIIIGNLMRNVEEESRTYVPPRTFTPEPAPPTVGQSALIIRDGQPKPARTSKGRSSDATRAVETIKAVIPKAKRGRPAGKSNSQDVPINEPAAKLTIRDKIKEAGKAVPHSNKLTEKEIDELREPLQTALSDEFEQLDKLLWLYEGDQSIEQPIWSDINDSEMEKLVNAILNMGSRSATVATIARASVDLSDYIIAGTLLAPRLQSTAKLVGDVRKRKKATRGR